MLQLSFYNFCWVMQQLNFHHFCRVMLESNYMWHLIFAESCLLKDWFLPSHATADNYIIFAESLYTGSILSTQTTVSLVQTFCAIRHCQIEQKKCCIHCDWTITVTEFGISLILLYRTGFIQPWEYSSITEKVINFVS